MKKIIKLLMLLSMIFSLYIIGHAEDDADTYAPDLAHNGIFSDLC